jgi:lipoprotein signal peptidase
MNSLANRSYLIIFWVLALVVLVADQATKYGVHAYLFGKEDYRNEQLKSTWHLPLISGAFDLQIHYEMHDGRLVPHVNRGAVNGWLNSWEFGNEFFAAVSLLAACAIVYWIFRPAVRGDRVLCVALGLILGGTLGNLYDRVVFHGVRDFLHWYLWFLWPDFNVADSCLVCGAGLLLVHALFVSEEQPSEAEPRTEMAEALSTSANGLVHSGAGLDGKRP